MTIRQALRLARHALVSSDSADLDAQILLARALDVGRVFLFAHPENVLSDSQRIDFLATIERRAKGEPVAYILGSAGFYDIELRVTPATLIPRPETELLLEAALRVSESKATATVADIGAGSGALAIAFKKQRPKCAVYATDICAEALTVARQNAARYRADIHLLRGDLASPLLERGVKVDLLMANLPYIATDELARLSVADYEPSLALDGGADGLDCIRRLLRQLPAVCQPGAYVLLEIGAGQGAAVKRMTRNVCGAEADILRDYAGLDRIARLRLNPPPLAPHCHRGRLIPKAMA